MTFSEVSELWFKDKSRQLLSYAYLRSVSCSLRHANNFLGDLDITRIKPYQVDDVILTLAKYNPNTKQAMSKSSLKDILYVTRDVFEYAIDNDLAEKNPARNRKVPKNAVRTRRRALSNREQELIINTTDTRCYPASMVMMWCGLRTGEILGLDWKHIDVSNKIIYVQQKAQQVSNNEYKVVPGTKNGNTRKVPIPKKLLPILCKQKECSTGDLFCSQYDGSIHTPTSWKKAWKSYLLDLNLAAYGEKRNKFDPKGVPIVLDKITPHMLRHTYCTLLYKSGIHPLIASKLMGHSNVQITLDIYTHLDEEYGNQNIDYLNNYLDENFRHI